jgi:hypothetical protein
MYEQLPHSALRDLKVLFDGDLFELAQIELKATDVLYKGKRGKPQPTVNGLVAGYARLMNLELEPLRRAVARQGVSLGACVYLDDSEAP